jgi:predicted TIM-barrel fold metal-dependent hydrolase
MPAGFMATLKTFYYDLAGATNAGAVASLLQLVQPDRVLFGTDFPPGGAAADYVTSLRQLKMFSESALRAVERDNAVRLLPRLGPV